MVFENLLIMKNTIVRFGLIGGIISIAFCWLNWQFIALTLGYIPSQIIGYLSIVLTLSVIPIGIKNFKDKTNNYTINFGQGFKTGAGILSITCILVFFGNWMFFSSAGDTFKTWRNQALSTGELQRTQEQFAAWPEYMSSSWYFGLVTALGVFLLGMIINLISVMILKNTNEHK